VAKVHADVALDGAGVAIYTSAQLDENLPASLAALLTGRGHDTDTVLSEGLLGEDDLEVAVAAKAAGRMLFTLDKGFGDIRAHPPGTHPPSADGFVSAGRPEGVGVRRAGELHACMLTKR
jgi:hypothetical protein